MKVFIFFIWIKSALALQQQVFSTSVFHKENVLHGSYLHLSDIHMDKNYKVGATVGSICHQKHKKKNETRAGYWGAPSENCDTPERFVYHSIETIAKEWKNKIDFIIWTGDNARHDSDPSIIRTKKEIIGYNKKIAKLMKQAFTLDNNKTLPIIPVIGNNDIHPHNHLRGMKDNPQLLKFSQLWSDFIPDDQVKEFQRGGYYTVKVVPGLRVIALNTLYFFSSNDVVTTCTDPTSPGARQFRWLKKQLKHADKDQSKVILIGHVPPTVKTFKYDCLDEYIRLSTRYSNIIKGHMYGHSNFDHFQIISKQIVTSSYTEKIVPLSNTKDREENNRFILSLQEQYRQVNKVAQRDELVVVHIAPPLLPLFYPAFRINEYDTNRSSTSFGDWLKYTQWFANLTYWNEQVDSTTRKNLPPQFEIEYSTDTTYKMHDLTTDSWLKLASSFTEKKGRKLWRAYIENMFVQTDNTWYG